MVWNEWTIEFFFIGAKAAVEGAGDGVVICTRVTCPFCSSTARPSAAIAPPPPPLARPTQPTNSSKSSVPDLSWSASANREAIADLGRRGEG